MHQAAVRKGDKIVEESRLFFIAKNAVNPVVVLQVVAQTIQEPQQAVMRKAAYSDRWLMPGQMMRLRMKPYSLAKGPPCSSRATISATDSPSPRS